MPDEPALLVVAHADDEIIGAGNWLATLPANAKPRVTIVYVTNSAPDDPWFTWNAGFQTREEYADARRRERAAALSLADIGSGQIIDFGYTDQQSWQHLVEITDRLAEVIRKIRPGVVLTHPYEGGHPDHDSAAFAVRQAVEHTDSACRIREFTSYHAGAGGLETGRFLPYPDSSEQVVTLNEAERERKRAMFACHRTQARVLAWFDIAEERFRDAPRYDFTQPPHPGTLHYESLNWGVTGEMWRNAAQQALGLLTQRCSVWD